MNNIKIYGTIFTNRNTYGDFQYMIKSGTYNDALFIYNDNEEAYFTNSYNQGAGNAIIRKYNQYGKYKNNPFSVGICTGTLEDGGYTELNNRNKMIIDDCIRNILIVLQHYNKKRLFYSSKNHTGILGTGKSKQSV